jgi:hypothetical protein
MNEQEEKFEESLSKENDYKLIVDFKDLNLHFPNKQMEIEDIKYKKKKVLKQSTVDLKKKKESDLF